MSESNRLERKITLIRLALTAESVRYLLKANFNPDQPRIPAGNPGGGRWTDGLALPAGYKPTDYVDLRKEEGKRGAHTILYHVGKSDDEIVARMGPPLKWWQPIRVLMYRNGSFFSIEDANYYANEALRRHASIVANVADGRLDRAFLKIRVGKKIGREAFRFDPYEAPIVRDAYEVGVSIKHDPTDPKGFIVITAYPRNEEPMTLKSIQPPHAFVTFAEGMIQDAEFLDTVDDLLRFCLQGIPRGEIGDFITFVKHIENGEIDDLELEKLWIRSGADFGGPAYALRILLTRARKLAEKEGPDGSLYKKHPKWNDKPSPKILI